jgi:formylglycine-generating enzyme required for sulfatase activity
MTGQGSCYFIGVGVADPAPGSVLERLRETENDVGRLSTAFERLGYHAVDTSAWGDGGELTAHQFSDGVGAWIRNLQSEDSVVFYFTGHALHSEAFDTHYLCFRGCRPDAPRNGGLPATDLATLFLGGPVKPSRVWLILDCCYAGHGLENLAETFATYHPASASEHEASVWVTSSCGRIMQYGDGAFSQALARALSKPITLRALPSVLAQELGPHAMQTPRTRRIFGNADFFDEAGVAPPVHPSGLGTRRRLQRARRSRSPLTLVAVAAGVAVLAAVAAFVAFSGDRPAADTTPVSSPDMVRVGPGELLLGDTEAAARRSYTDCQASLGAACGERFESSVFAREVRPAGAAPVSIRGFYLDRTEVSLRVFVRWLNLENAKLHVEGVPPYERVIDASAQPIVAVRSGSTKASAMLAIRYAERAFFVDDERYADNPVTLVSWHGARQFCEAQGKRLPTEREWELAARGSDGRRFPWGELPPELCEEVVFGRSPGGVCERGVRGAMPVGTSRGDVSAEGVRDLGGNVAEWTASPFEEPSAAGSPCGGDAGPCRAVRGGSYIDGPLLLRGSLRSRRGENELWPNVGFRCARDGDIES